MRRLWREWMRPHGGELAVGRRARRRRRRPTGLYPVLIKVAFDAFSAKDAHTIMLAPIVVVVVTAVKGFALHGLTVLTNRVVTRIEADMQTALYAHLIDADLAQLERENPASLTQRFTTDFTFVKEALTRLINSVPARRGDGARAGRRHALDRPGLTLVVLLIAPFVACPIARIGKKLRRVASSTQEQIGIMASLVSESLRGRARRQDEYGSNLSQGAGRHAFEDRAHASR